MDISRLVIEAKLLQYRTRLEAMLAENKDREFRGFSLAYNEESFESLEKDIEELLYKLKILREAREK